MAVSDAQKRASEKYFKNNYAQVRLTMPKTEAEALAAYCKEHGLTKQGFIRDLIKREINKEA